MEYNTIEDVIVIVLIITISASVLSGFFNKPEHPTPDLKKLAFWITKAMQLTRNFTYGFAGHSSARMPAVLQFPSPYLRNPISLKKIQECWSVISRVKSIFNFVGSAILNGWHWAICL